VQGRGLADQERGIGGFWKEGRLLTHSPDTLQRFPAVGERPRDFPRGLPQQLQRHASPGTIHGSKEQGFCGRAAPHCLATSVREAIRDAPVVGAFGRQGVITPFRASPRQTPTAILRRDVKLRGDCGWRVGLQIAPCQRHYDAENIQKLLARERSVGLEARPRDL